MTTSLAASSCQQTSARGRRAAAGATSCKLKADGGALVAQRNRLAQEALALAEVGRDVAELVLKTDALLVGERRQPLRCAKYNGRESQIRRRGVLPVDDF
eukprot:scaffold29717_cov57-Phaeocystis_antarctica.AAC.3